MSVYSVPKLHRRAWENRKSKWKRRRDGLGKQKKTPEDKPVERIHTLEQMLGLEQEEFLKKRMLSIMICTNWVCAGF